jgi:nucleotide-binding universal stress UspA family protein
MIKKVLVALDGSARSERSLPWVLLLARGADKILLRVVEPVYALDIYAGSLVHELQIDAQKYLLDLAPRIKPAPETLVRLGPAAPVILDVAREKGADLIALTTHGGSKVRRRLFGGTSEKLIHGSEIPLLIVPAWSGRAPRPVERVRKILVPLDGSTVSEKILPLAQQLSQDMQASLVLVHVQTGNRPAPMDRLSSMGGKVVVIKGKVPDMLVTAALGEGADLIVMSAHGYGGLQRMFLGSVASKLIRETPVPVLVVRHDALRRFASLQEMKGVFSHGR